LQTAAIVEQELLTEKIFAHDAVGFYKAIGGNSYIRIFTFFLYPCIQSQQHFYAQKHTLNPPKSIRGEVWMRCFLSRWRPSGLPWC
jgi:hypothetical protein